MTPKIFICYRRADSEFVADPIYNEMKHYFGEGNVFLDVEDIPFGVDFRAYLKEQIAAHDVILVLIGPRWGDIMRERADQANDFVRIEIENALAQNKLIIPVLVMRQDALPDFSTLPPSIADLQWLNPAQIRRGPDFKIDCQRITFSINRAFAPSTQRTEAPQVKRQLKVIEEKNTRLETVQAAVESARTFTKTGKRNRDWTPFITTFPHLKIPDMPFCLVPTGSKNSRNKEQSNQPETLIEPFYIAQYPVTNAQWRMGVKAGIVRNLQIRKDLDWYNDPQMANAPVVGVDWFECQKFAQWMGCRLPTETEWRYAAQGVDNSIYPWGNDFNVDYVVSKENSDGKPAEVSSKPEGKSWIGAYHMMGNVYEWTVSLFKPNSNLSDKDQRNKVSDDRVILGGSWMDEGHALQREFYRLGGNPKLQSIVNVGLRLVRST